MTTNTSSDKPAPTASALVGVKDIKVHGAPHVGRLKRPREYYVRVTFGQSRKKTAIATGNDPTWPEYVSFDASGPSVLKLDLYAYHRCFPDTYVGGTKKKIDVLHPRGASEVCTRTLSKYNLKRRLYDTQTIIEFTVVFSTASAVDMTGTLMDKAVTEGNNAINRMKSTSPALDHIDGAFDPDGSIVDGTVSTADLWKPLLEKITWLTKIVDRVSEIHPYAKMAWDILSAAHKAILDQKSRDESITHLIGTMNEVYAFVHETEPLQKIKSHEKIVLLMAKQTIECAYFIRDYAKNKSFWLRTMKHTMSDVDSKIKQYEDKFKELGLAFQEQAILETEITVLRILDNVENLAAEIDLNDMPYAEGARYQSDRGCLQGTREEMIDKICQWVKSDDDDVPRMLLLSGVAGSGKSAIAHTVAHRFDQVGRLGSSFFFDRSHQAVRRPDNIFSTIARDLAELDPRERECLSRVIQGKKSLRTTSAPREQFEQFILKPALELTFVGPIVIVIDGLDESADPASRSDLLSVLADKVPKLPPNFRVLVTTRAEQDIHEALAKNSDVVCEYMDAISRESSDRDIASFIRTQLRDVPSLQRKWPNDAWCQLLVEKSEGLFQWAFTACRFIRGKGKGGLNPAERLSMLVTSTFKNNQSDHMDQLYLRILSQIFDAEDNVVMERFRSVLGNVLIIKDSLSISALKSLCYTDESADIVDLILQPLGSLLSGITQDFPVRPLHTSFRDFLTSPSRGGSFFIDISLHHNSLSRACLRVMKTELRFNICGLETSCVLNREIPDLAARVKNAIPTHLSYACRFWANHLHATPFDGVILKEVKNFMHIHLLFWLEVLSLTKQVNTAPTGLSSVIKWSRTHDDDIALFVNDALKFVATFGTVISQSAPHIYVSALPFAPEQSKVSQTYLSQFPKTLLLKSGKAITWPALQCIMQVPDVRASPNPNTVWSVAFSPDGMHIASCLDDGTVCVWDAETGEIVSVPIEGHVAYAYPEFSKVRSVAYSLDGKRLVYGSEDNTICVRDIDMGKAVSSPFKAPSMIQSFAFSPDGTCITSGSWDGTICVWNTETWKVVSGPFQSIGNISSVAFSPDGKRIVSGSGNNVCVWDTQAGVLVPDPFEGHTDHVTSVAFSPDGRHIVSGSKDSTIRLWDTETGRVVSGPFKGHTNGVNSVAFSPDGTRIVSGSNDETVRVWDTKTGSTVSGPFKEHTSFVYSVAFSPDGTRIVSGSADGTIRLWDPEPGDQVLGASKGPDDEVQYVTFSPNGTWIVSSSYQGTIYVWDAKNGGVVSGPFTRTLCDSIAISPDGMRIVIGSHTGTLRLLDIKTGTFDSEPFQGHTERVKSIAFSPDGTRVASGSYDKTIRVWNTKTWEVVAGPLTEHDGFVFSVAFSPDGARIVSSLMMKKALHVWDIETGQVASGPFKGFGQCAVFSPDGLHIASCIEQHNIYLLDAATGEISCGPFEGHKRPVSSIAFSPDGMYIVSGSRDKTIRVWDTKTGGIVFGPFRGHTKSINSVAFSPDGTKVVSGSWDKAIRVWDLKPGETTDVTGHQQESTSTWFKDDTVLENGWVLNPPSTLLFWVPPWNRLGLWWPRNSLVIAETPTKLDFRQFVHGTSWSLCHQPTV